MVCHVYIVVYCKVITIAVCDMQFKDTMVQCNMWRKLNELMRENRME
jgi:hypothetical protein